MAIEDGNYVIVSAIDTSKAIDAMEALDVSGNNVYIFDRNDTDAQVVHVSTNSNGTRTLWFPLTGCVLDVYGQGGADETNVWQFDCWPESDAKNSPAQQFDIVATGGTVRVDYGGVSGQVFETYYIEYHKDPTKVLDVYESGTDNRTNVQIFTKHGGANQRWAFLPMPSIADGTYQIVSALDEGVSLDVPYDSSANGTSVQLWTTYESCENNSQTWVVENMPDGTCTIRHAGSGKALDASLENGTPRAGTNAVIWELYYGRQQYWLIKPHGVVTRKNDVVEPTYEIRCKAGVNILLDACGASSVPETNVWLWDELYWQDGQHWSFRPTEAYSKTLPVPSAILHGKGDTNDGRIAAISERTRVYPSWAGTGSPYQVRYRIRKRNPGDENSFRGKWGTWRSIRNGRAANHGWDDVWKANCSAARAGDRWYCDKGVLCEIDLAKGYDLVDIEYQVRRASFGPQGKAHGGSASQVCTVAYRPTCSVRSLSLSPNGLYVGLDSDFPRSGNTWSASVYDLDGNCLFKYHSESGKAHSSGVTIPWSKMCAAPERGQTVKVNWTIVTCDGVKASGSEQRSVSYASGSSASLAPTVASASGARKKVSFPSGASRVWVVCDGVAREVEDGYALYPLRRDYEIVALLQLPDGTWNVWQRGFSSEGEPYYMWNWGNSWFRIRWGKGSAPKLSISSDRDYEANLTNGSDFEVVSMGGQRKEQWTVKGALVPGPDEVEAELNRFGECSHCVHRDPFGHVVDAAVVSVSTEYGPGGAAEVSVTMRRTG